MVIEISIDTVVVDAEHRIEIAPQISQQTTPGQPAIPVLKEVLVGVPSSATIDIFTEGERSISSVMPVPAPAEMAKGMDITLDTDTWDGTLYPTHIVNMTANPDIRGNTSSVLTVFPLQLNQNNLRWWKEITIQITWQSSSVAENPSLLTEKPLRFIDNKIRVRRSRTTTLPDYHFSENIAKIIVDSTAWYVMTMDELADSGLTVQGIDPRTLRLWNKTEEVKLFVEGEEDGVFNSGDRIIFFGEQNLAPDGSSYTYNFYTNENVYWLTWNDDVGERYILEGAYPGEDVPEWQKPIFFQETKHIEENDYFSRLGQVEEKLHHQWDDFDHFFMNPPIYSGTSTDYIIELDYPASSNFTIEFEFQGITDGTHELQIELNGHLIGSQVNWSGQTSHQFSIEVFEQQNIPISNGENQLTVINLEQANEENHYDMVYLNWLDIQYERFLTTSDDELTIVLDEGWSGNMEFNCRGFTSPNIYIFKEDFSRIGDFIVLQNPQDEQYTVVFQDVVGSNSSDYFLFTSDSLRRVISIMPTEPISSLLSDVTSTYIAICPDSFKVILEPLVLDERNGTIVDIDDIYRQYSHGILSPYAIKDFLTDVYFSGGRTLSHVLIAMQGGWPGFGGGNLPDEGYIPAMRMQTVKWGAASSDYWYSCVEGNDIFSDFAIGRMPARDMEELSVIVDKTLYYEQMDDETWHNHMLMIAGYEDTFKEQSESMIHPIIHDGYFPSRLYIDVTSETGQFFGGTMTLLDYLAEGQTYVNFLGHGGGAVWGDRSLLTLEALPYLDHAEKLPFVTSMTCFTGDVTNPNGLGRKMLALENGGALAWFGSSGVGWIINDYLLLQSVHELLFSDLELSLGEIIQQAKIDYVATNQQWHDLSITQAYQFNYSGDPALRLKKPEAAEFEIDISDPEPEDEIQITLIPSPTDSIFYQVFDPQNAPVNFRPEEWTGSYTVSDTANSGVYALNIAGKTNNTLVHASIPFSISGSYIAIAEITPPQPTMVDSIQVLASAHDRQGIDSLQLWMDGEYYSEMHPSGHVDEYILTELIPPQNPGSSHTLKLIAVDSEGNSTESNPFYLSILHPPDFEPVSLYFTINDSISLTSIVKNMVSVSGESEVLFQRLDAENQWVTLGTDRLEFDGVQELEANISGAFSAGTHTYRVITNTAGHTLNTSNDTLKTSLTTSAFFVTGGDSVGIPGIDAVIQSGTGIFQLLELDDVNTSLQPEFYLHMVDSLRQGTEILCSDGIEYYLNWRVQADSLPIQPYKYFDEFETWLPIDDIKTDSSVGFSSSGRGMFAFFTTDDVDSPRLDATVNGQRFLDNSYVNTSPVIFISALDENGLDHRRSNMQCWTNSGDSVAIQHISGKANNLGIRLAPTLSTMDSTIQLLVSDASGNMSDTLHLHFIVKEKLELIDYGNFPNPFKNTTRFAYELTETVDRFYLDIYTVSGRRIRRFTSASALTDLDPKVGAFHEILWDGRNDAGEFVANGVYFYKMVAKKGKTVIERIGKVAKAR